MVLKKKSSQYWRDDKSDNTKKPVDLHMANLLGVKFTLLTIRWAFLTDFYQLGNWYCFSLQMRGYVGNVQQ